MTDPRPQHEPPTDPVVDADVLIRRAHAAAEDAGRAGYEDPATGLFVLTRTSLLANGRCCGNGCRHCPYGGTRRGEGR